MFLILTFCLFVSFSENLSISFLSVISAISISETNLTINYKLFALIFKYFVLVVTLIFKNYKI